MFNTLYLLSYNNYYNRLIKREESLEEYLDYELQACAGINFNPNDGVDTEITLNVADSLNPDYVLVVDDANKITSRWFIIDKMRVRSGQYKINLHRDVIADYYNVIAEAPCFIEKGYVSNSNPLVYNNEKVTLNQIKKGEFLLKNKIGTPWLLAYLARFTGEEDNFIYNTFSGEFQDESELVPDYQFTDLSEYMFYKYQGSSNAYRYTNDIQFGMYYNTQEQVDDGLTNARDKIYGISSNGYFYGDVAATAYQVLPIYQKETLPQFDTEEKLTSTYSTLFNQYISNNIADPASGLKTNTYTGLGNFEDYSILTQESNKIIQVGTGKSAKYYRVSVNINSIYSAQRDFILTNSAGLFGKTVFNALTSKVIDWSIPNGAYINPFIRIPHNVSGAYLTLTEVNINNPIKYEFTYSSNITSQTPYEIIAAPLYDVTFTKGNLTINHSGSTALSWFTNLPLKNGAKVYDIQIVPFCPIDDLDITNYKIASCYYSSATDLTPLAVAIKLPNASFTQILDVPNELPRDNNYKISVNCDLYRLCSPNGIGDFDFSVAKNKGLLGFEVDCTLIPFNPYIKINPLFNGSGLYGGDYNDFRGLICKGDFSLPIISSSWTEYQLNNKYYQDIFDRETKTLEKENKWGIAETVTQVVAGTASGAVSGAIAGSFVPGLGTISGAIAGGALSAAGGVADVVKTNALIKERMSAREDQFELNLQTIQARPNTLTRTTAFNINNKYFPYIEYYSCTDEEKEIFKNKITYNGMTINAIGSIQNYIGPDWTFIKGKLIRLPIEDDYHVAQTIVNEVIEGIYLGGN